jgi:hypothetical protein
VESQEPCWDEQWLLFQGDACLLFRPQSMTGESATDTCCYLLFVNHNEFADTSRIRKFRNFEMEFLTVCSSEIGAEWRNL